MATRKIKTKEIFIRRKTINGVIFGPIMLLKSKRPVIIDHIQCQAIGELTLNTVKQFSDIETHYHILKGVSLPVSFDCMERLMIGIQTRILHKIDANYNIFTTNGELEYVKLYDYDGHCRFYIIDTIKSFINLREKYISIDLGEMFYEKRS